MVRSVAIIGGGLSGLAAAYELKKHGVDFKVFEAVHHIGGNMRTIRNLQVGGISRWVDLGVNDFSKTGYKNLVRVLDELGVQYRPLQDESSFATIDRRVPPDEAETGFTVDGRWKNPPSDAVREGIKQFKAFCEKHIDELLNDPRAKYKYMTVGQFVQWAGLNDEFVHRYLYPRIAGMYFTSGVPPWELPVRVVIHYYYLQEGLGKPHRPDPQRMYWVNGTRSWVDALCTALDPDYAADASTRLLTHTYAKVWLRDDGRVDVHYSRNGEDIRETFDALVMARQAWDVMGHFIDPAQAPDGLAATLGRFGASTDDVVVHTSPNVLPQNVNTWRTYNIAIPPSYAAGDLGYTITYSCNRHQNDAANPEYNCESARFRERCHMPQYFLTVNPVNAIPEGSRLLPRPGKRAANCTMFSFRHNVMDMRSFRAQQDELPRFQGLRNIWYVGGYTIGVGLQEECWVGAVDTVRGIIDPGHEPESRYRHTARGLEPPRYIHDLIFGEA